MKATLLKAVVCVTLVFASVLNSNVMAQDKFVTNDVMAGELVSSKVIYRHDGMLYRHMKHDFTYDDQNRVVEKEMFKWDSGKEVWVPCSKIALNYTLGQVEMNLAKWNEKDKMYNEAQEKNVYQMDLANLPIAYQNYKWNERSGEWKIAEDYRFGSTAVMYAIN
ncbi:DUF3836 domain-containing protein [Bacteroides sp. 51]|uniref:DUF3836 domain-containing protein n=1 Tax=Bacteroides sp. 51 TaxID=2302938 RepID=UPI0013D69448|nr:DUF3836 domain-containing protein [Bacteroides sp. 51]NDV81669.1 DUF3836 domain-containing protein [Bacteroides sp. 51]